MARKIIALNAEVQKAKEKLAEVELLSKEAEKEEINLIESLKTTVQQIETDNNVFIGAILTRQDLLAIIDIALQSGEPVMVPFRIYIND